MFTRTSEYALQALIYLAQHKDDWPIPGQRIADATEIPAKYLSKILGDLVREGMLDSSRGTGGGFWMTREPQEISLHDAVRLFEPVSSGRCPFGNMDCDKSHHCIAHDRWAHVREVQETFLRETSIRDVIETADGSPSCAASPEKLIDPTTPKS
jgi:Rrf2 family iron-sulfur cluster assembly transcriptional regulator